MDAFPGRRVGPGRTPRPSTRSFTLGACVCAVDETNHTTASQSGKRDEKGILCRRPGPITHLCEFSLFIADSHLPVALTAPSARGCTVCHVGLSRPALDGRQHSSAKCKQFSVYERVLFVSGPHRITSPTPNFQHGASPRARLSARLPTFKTTRGGGVPPVWQFLPPPR